LRNGYIFQTMNRRLNNQHFGLE